MKLSTGNFLGAAVLVSAVALAGCSTTGTTTQHGVQVTPTAGKINLTTNDPITFYVDSATLTNRDRANLQDVVKVVKKHTDSSWMTRPSYKDEAGQSISGPYNLVITGHTSSTGSAMYNQHLSENRADAVAHYLESLGVSKNVIKVHGAGETSPVTSNGTKHGRATNRRVEIELVPAG